MPTLPLTPSSRSPRPHLSSGCPFRDGPATLDGLLAEIGAQGGEALDVALDLRFAYQQRHDAESCVALALRLRRLLGDRHYLAFYRVRVWLSRALAAEVRSHRGEAWERVALPIQASALEPLEHACVQRWAQDHTGRYLGAAQVRFIFTESSASLSNQCNPALAKVSDP